MDLGFAGAIVYYAYLLVGSATLGYLALRFTYPDIRTFPNEKKLGASAILGAVLVLLAIACDYLFFGWEAVAQANGFTTVFLFVFFLATLVLLMLFFTMRRAPLVVGIRKPAGYASEMPKMETIESAKKTAASKGPAVEEQAPVEEKVDETEFRDLLKTQEMEFDKHLIEIRREIDEIHDEISMEEPVKESPRGDKKMAERKSVREKLEELRKAGIIGIEEEKQAEIEIDALKIKEQAKPVEKPVMQEEKLEEIVPELEDMQQNEEQPEKSEAEEKAEQAVQELLEDEKEEEVLEIKQPIKPKGWLDGITSLFKKDESSKTSAALIKEEVTGKPSKEKVEARQKELKAVRNTQDETILGDILGERFTESEKEETPVEEEEPRHRHRLYAAGEQEDGPAEKDSEFGDLIKEVYPELESKPDEKKEDKHLRRYERTQSGQGKRQTGDNELEALLTQMDSPDKTGARKEAVKGGKPADGGVSMKDLFGEETEDGEKTPAPTAEGGIFGELNAISEGEKKSVLPGEKTEFMEVEKKPGRGCPTCGKQNARIIFCPYCGSGMCANCSPLIKPNESGFTYVCPKCREEVEVKKGEK
ncbi:MAG: hypothetical protein V1834_00355 [Candidatus Micrarchaeota archaeon]